MWKLLEIGADLDLLAVRIGDACDMHVVGALGLDEDRDVVAAQSIDPRSNSVRHIDAKAEVGRATDL